MKPTPLRVGTIVTGAELFRIASLCLYITLLLHVTMAGVVRHLSPSLPGLASGALLLGLCLLALARHRWPHAFGERSRWLLAEQALAVSAIVILTLEQATSTQSLPWLIGAAGIFPLVQRQRIALLATFALAALGMTIDVLRGLDIVDWLPQVFATLFVGLSSVFLAEALASNLAALRQSRFNERRFDAIARATRHALLITDARFQLKFANQALEDSLGYRLDEIRPERAGAALHPEDAKEHIRKMRYLRDTSNSSIFSRHRIRHKDGQWLWLETRGYNLLDDPAVDGLLFSIEDITARREAELRLREEHALLRTVLDLNPSIIYVTDTQGRFTITNLAFQRRFGCRSGRDAHGKTFHDILPCQAGLERAEAANEIAQRLHWQDLEVIRSNRPLPDQEIQGLWDDDLRRWYRVTKYPLHDGAGRVSGMLCIARDISDRKEYEMRLEYQALHDPLTGLPNRRYLLKTIADSIESTQAEAGRLAMLFCDLDFFKSVNEIHGHDFGDKCLMEITRRIQAELEDGDFVARFGDNEFAILSQASVEQARAKADALLQTVSQQLVVEDAAVKIQASIGIAELDPEYRSPSDLIRAADAALSQAKERGRNRAEIYDAASEQAGARRAQMDVGLRFALERNEFRLLYQPKVSILDGAVKGFELLLRWDSSQYGPIAPADFIPVAESSGLVVPIGLWTLEQACLQLRDWQRGHGAEQKCTIAVNVSMRQLLQPSFLADVAGILARTGVPAGAIELELTETSAMANPMQAIDNLSKLKQLGLRLALDDFGTGYSSLAHLQKLPVDVLKIDKTFVQGLHTDRGEAEIVRLILALAQTLNLETVAEGVETRENMAQLRKMGCYLAQGFVFAPPLPAAEAAQLLQNGYRFPVV